MFQNTKKSELAAAAEEGGDKKSKKKKKDTEEVRRECCNLALSLLRNCFQPIVPVQGRVQAGSLLPSVERLEVLDLQRLSLQGVLRSFSQYEFARRSFGLDGSRCSTALEG